MACVKLDSLEAAAASSVKLKEDGPILCSKCHACLSCLSAVAGKVWICEYCRQHNQVRQGGLAKRQMGGGTEMDLVFRERKKKVLKRPASVVFVMDISGSMGVTTPVPYQPVQGGPPWKCQCGAENPASTIGCGSCGVEHVYHVSRLRCMQDAVKAQLQQLLESQPAAFAGLVAFNDEIVIIGDGSGDVRVLPETMLYDADALAEVGAGLRTTVPLKDSLPKLLESINALRPSGQTALGPALLLAVAMAGGGAVASKVIVCTDGLSNVGLGAVSPECSPEQRKCSREYFDSVSLRAMDGGVRVSIVSIEGEDCNLQLLGRVAEVTGGDVRRSSPTELGHSVATLLSQDRTIASRVRVNLVLHTALQPIRNGFAHSQQGSAVPYGDTRLVGAAGEGSEVYFAFGLRPDVPPHAVSQLQAKEVPFQAQVRQSTSLCGVPCAAVVVSSPRGAPAHRCFTLVRMARSAFAWCPVFEARLRTPVGASVRGMRRFWRPCRHTALRAWRRMSGTTSPGRSGWHSLTSSTGRLAARR